MSKDFDWMEQALEDDNDLPKTVRKQVHAYNSDRTDISPDEMAERIDKRNGGRWALVLLVLLVVAVVFAKWKGLI